MTTARTCGDCRFWYGTAESKSKKTCCAPTPQWAEELVPVDRPSPWRLHGNEPADGCACFTPREPEDTKGGET